MNKKKHSIKDDPMFQEPRSIEQKTVDPDLGVYLGETVIKNTDELIGLKEYKNAAIARWFADTDNKIPAIVDNRGTVYLVNKADQSKREMIEYPKLLRLLSSELDEQATIRYVLRNVLASAIKNLDPKNLQEQEKRGSAKIVALINRGIELGATDVHMHVVGDTTTISYRIHDRLIKDSQFGSAEGETIQIAMFQKHVKSANDGSPARKGFFYHDYKGEQWLCRVSYGRSPETNHTQSLVMRLRSMEDIPDIHQLGYTPKQVKDIVLAMNNRGFTMIVGSVNSGKSTSQAGIMKMRPADQHNLEISAETEVMFPNFRQLVLPSQGSPELLPEWRKRMTALPMQHDCNYLAVNEINSAETANMIASMMMQGTGGISSIHGSGFGDAINRLKNPNELAVSEQILFSDSFFNLIIYQVLTGTLCPHCRLKEHPVDFWNEELRLKFGAKAENFRFHNPEGCDHCTIGGKKLGVIGRSLVAEVVPITHENRNHLRDPSNSQPMRDWIHANGRDTIHQHAFKQALTGKIDAVKIQEQIGTFSKYNCFDLVIERDADGKVVNRNKQGEIVERNRDGFIIVTDENGDESLRDDDGNFVTEKDGIINVTASDGKLVRQFKRNKRASTQ